ncbi:hypothetical protein [Streptomyces sp. NPDC002547]
MSPNQKKALVLCVGFLIAVIAGFVAGVTLAGLVHDATAWMCLTTGAFVWAVVLSAVIKIIGIFDFSDTRPPAPPQAPPNVPGTPGV